MSHATVAARSGVSEPTVKRILGGQLAEASFANVVAIAEALGMTVGLGETDAEELCRQQARRKAEQIARLVQGTSALESQAVDQAAYERLVERSFHELMAGSRRRLWAE
jgi:transcriptional regulator with XRE-family HTH domain